MHKSIPMQTRTRIKICGIRDSKTATACVEAGADAIGLVFAKGSPREVTIKQATEVVRSIPALVTPIALFVNPTVEEVRRVSDATGITTIQLHGQESLEFAASLHPLTIIKAVAFNAADVRQKLSPWKCGNAASNVRALLIDTPPKSNAVPGHAGGTGEAFDWDQLAKLMADGLWSDLPEMVLAGGLTPSNVVDAIRLLRPFAVDVSSGVESSRGVKDVNLIRAFCAAVATTREDR